MKTSFNRLPTLFVYDRIPSGVGLSPRLYELQDAVMAAVLEQVSNCGCEQGCPSCVGPVSDVDEDIKARTRQTLEYIVDSTEKRRFSRRAIEIAKF